MGAAAFEDVLLAVVEDALPAVVEDALPAVVDDADIAVLLGTVVFPAPPQNVIKRLTYKLKVQAIFHFKKIKMKGNGRCFPGRPPGPDCHLV